MAKRADDLAQRVELGARTLAEFVESLNDIQWQAVVPQDGRTLGVMVHHVASVYPLELKLARMAASGEAIEGVTYDSAVRDMNAKHATEHSGVTRLETLELLRENSKAAAEGVRQFRDEELDRAVPVSLNGGALLTSQFVIEDHLVRHSIHHLSRMRAALK